MVPKQDRSIHAGATDDEGGHGVENFVATANGEIHNSTASIE